MYSSEFCTPYFREKFPHYDNLKLNSCRGNFSMPGGNYYSRKYGSETKRLEKLEKCHMVVSGLGRNAIFKFIAHTPLEHRFVLM